MNWSYLGAVLPPGIEIIDFYHACEHLKAAFDAAYGENSAKSKAQFEKYRHFLRDEHEASRRSSGRSAISETPTRARESSRPSLLTFAATVTACALRRRKRRTSPSAQGSSKPRARRSRPNG